MKQNFRLVKKFRQNEIGIFIVLQSGEVIMIARIVCPDDNQLGDNVALADEILPALQKRLKRSL